jgi:beta-galactosidase
MNNRFSEHMSYDDKSFIIKGKRRFLISGTIHYFRVPEDLWEDRLKKAKQAGFNCIETYIAWNCHEYEEEKYNFNAGNDIEKFLDLCLQQDMYIIVRPGPYICAEWDFGGFPAWFQKKRGLKPRRYNAVYLKYVKRWFDILLPKLAKYQITRGGPIIMMQVENELGNIKLAGLSDHEATLYMKALEKIFDENGIDVPLITCEGGLKGALECINEHEPHEKFNAYRNKYPGFPVMCTEFWPGWYSTWTSKEDQVKREPQDVENATWHILINGGQGYNYYMWHGGTNFGYNTMYLQTTSYDFTAPLNETGCFTEKYFLTRKVAKYAQAVEEILVDSISENCINVPLLVSDVLIHRRKGGKGEIIFLENLAEHEKDIKIPDSDGGFIQTTLGSREIKPVTCKYSINDNITLVLTTSILLENVFLGDKQYIILYDERGRNGILKLSGDFHISSEGHIKTEERGNSVCFQYAHMKALQRITVHEGAKEINLLIIDNETAKAIWKTENKIYIGPQYADVENEKGKFYLKTPLKKIMILSSCGIEEVSLKNEIPLKASMPILEGWKCINGIPEAETNFDDSEWEGSMEPQDMTLYGTYQGNGWYRTAILSETDKKATLFIEKYADRIHLFVNGEFIRTSAVTEENRLRHPSFESDIHLKKGGNTISILVENLGRIKGDWQLGFHSMDEDFKGIEGVFLNCSHRIQDWRYRGQLYWEYKGFTGYDHEKTIEARKDGLFRIYESKFLINTDINTYQHLKILLTGLYKGIVWINGFNIGRYWLISRYDTLYIPSKILKNENFITIFEETESEPDNASLIYDPEDNFSFIAFI